MTTTEKKELNVDSITQDKLSWIYIERPSNAEVKFLEENFHFHPLNLDDVLSRVQRPKIEEYWFVICNRPTKE